jgi:drug/metabolite transporter (DMT)-like permease
MSIGAALLAPLSLVERPWRALPAAPAVSWLALLYLIVSATFLSFLWWNAALRRLGPGRAGAFSNLVPVFGVVLAWAVLGETLGPFQMVGALLAIAGVVVCQDVDLAPAAAWLRSAARRARRADPEAPGEARKME